METNKKSAAALILRVLGLLTGITGITVHMLANTVIETGFMVKHNLAYFTLQTNIFSTVIFAVLVIKTLVALKKEHRLIIASINPMLHIGFTLYITITMLGYWLMLSPMMGVPKDPLLLCDTIFLHTLTPLFAIADWLLFIKHGTLKKTDAVKWLLYPVIYLISVIIVSLVIKEPYYTFKMGGETISLLFPYPFLDPQVVTIGGTIGISAVLAVVFTLLGLLYVFIDTKLSKRK